MEHSDLNKASRGRRFDARPPDAFKTQALTALVLAGVALAAPLAYAALDRQPAAVPQAAAERLAAMSFSAVFKEVLPAVVNISTTARVDNRHGLRMPGWPQGSPFEKHFREFFEDGSPNAVPRRPHGKMTSLGSGFVVDPDGYVVTNNHVIADASRITVTIQNGESVEAEVVGRDAKTDLALLKIEVDEPLPFVAWGDSDRATVGDWVLTVGNPFGLGGTVTAGIISARGRDIHSGPFDDFLQIDAPINRGSSGGPAFDVNGRVIGVNTAIFSPNGGNVGIGFAIPASVAEPVIAELKANGEVRRGWLGVEIQKVTPEIAESLGLETAEGALVARVRPGGPADEAGIQQGDLILRFDGTKVARIRDLPRIVAGTAAGSTVEIELLRKSESTTVTATIGRMKNEQRHADAGPERSGPGRVVLEDLGLTVASLTPEARQHYGIADALEGAVVVAVAEDGTAAKNNLRRGDVIIGVDQSRVSSADDVAAKVENIRNQERPAILMLIDRGGEQRFVALEFADA